MGVFLRVLFHLRFPETLPRIHLLRLDLENFPEEADCKIVVLLAARFFCFFDVLGYVHVCQTKGFR